MFLKLYEILGIFFYIQIYEAWNTTVEMLTKIFSRTKNHLLL